MTRLSFFFFVEVWRRHTCILHILHGSKWLSLSSQQFSARIWYAVFYASASMFARSLDYFACAFFFDSYLALGFPSCERASVVRDCCTKIEINPVQNLQTLLRVSNLPNFYIPSNIHDSCYSNVPLLPESSCASLLWTSLNKTRNKQQKKSCKVQVGVQWVALKAYNIHDMWFIQASLLNIRS